MSSTENESSVDTVIENKTDESVNTNNVENKRKESNNELSKGYVILAIIFLILGAVINESLIAYQRSYNDKIDELYSSLISFNENKASKLIGNMSNKQIGKAYNKYLQGIISDYEDYKDINDCSGSIYEDIISKINMLGRLKILHYSAFDKLPSPNDCFDELLSTENLQISLDYFNLFKSYGKVEDVDLENNIQTALAARSSYEEAYELYNDGNYSAALEKCNAIKNYENDTYNITRLEQLKDDASSNQKAEYVSTADSYYSSQDFEGLFNYLDKLENEHPDESDIKEYKEQYISRVVADAKSSYDEDDPSYCYNYCKAVSKYVESDSDFLNLYKKAAENYAQSLVDNDELDSAFKVAKDSISVFPDSQLFKEIQGMGSLERWQIVYDRFLKNDCAGMTFTLFGQDTYDYPYLLVVDEDQYNIYNIVDNGISGIGSFSDLYAFDKDKCIFYFYEYSTGSGYFENDYYDEWSAEKINSDGEFEQVDCYQLKVEEHYAAITNKTMSKDTFYYRIKDGDTEDITESEYNKAVKKIESFKKPDCVEVNEENINKLILKK